LNTLRPEEFTERVEAVPPFQIHITSFRLGGTYHCIVDNVDPGAIIARSEGPTLEQAERKAVTRAKGKLEHTRVRKAV
jgi:folate-dependent phosphoribosylglycinamide formyltransferase PurN